MGTDSREQRVLTSILRHLEEQMVPATCVIKRTGEEVQRAHDMLLPIAMGEVELKLSRRDEDGLRAALDVLCWVLGHSHNDAFQKNLALIEEELRATGIVVRRIPDEGKKQEGMT